MLVLDRRREVVDRLRRRAVRRVGIASLAAAAVAIPDVDHEAGIVAAVRVAADHVPDHVLRQLDVYEAAAVIAPGAVLRGRAWAVAGKRNHGGSIGQIADARLHLVHLQPGWRGVWAELGEVEVVVRCGECVQLAPLCGGVAGLVRT